MELGPQPRTRKRPRPNGGINLEGLLIRCEAFLRETAPDAHTLLLAARKLQQLQAAAESRLAGCPVDGLTPHEALEFIYRKRVRLMRIVRNDFEDGSGDEAGSASAAGPGTTACGATADPAAAASSLSTGTSTTTCTSAGVSASAGTGAVAGTDAGAGAGYTAGPCPAAMPAAARDNQGTSGPTDANGLVAGSCVVAAAAEAVRKRELVAHFQTASDRLAVACRAEGLAAVPGSRYVVEVRLAGSLGNGRVAATKGQVLLRCASDQEAPVVQWSTWEALQGRCGAFDRRHVADFARSTVLMGVFAELRRRFAREQSDSEDNSPSLLSTISVCEMLARAELPAAEGRPSAAPPSPAAADAPLLRSGALAASAAAPTGPAAETSPLSAAQVTSPAETAKGLGASGPGLA